MSMTPEQRTMVIWGGASAGGLLLAWLFPFGLGLLWRGEDLDEIKTKHAQLYQQYGVNYRADGLPASDAVDELNRAKGHQSEAVKEIERQLIPELPREYQVRDLTGAQDLVRVKHDEMRSRAESRKVALPSTLPFGLVEPDLDKQTMQLAQLFLCREVVMRCLALPFSRITAITPGLGYRDSGGGYATLLCEFDLEGAHPAAAQLLHTMLAEQNKGIGIRGVTITANPDGTQRTHLVANLLTVNRAGWKLPELPAPTKPASPGEGTKDSNAGGRTRGTRGGN